MNCAAPATRPGRPRPGTVLPLTATEASRLAQRWVAPADVLLTAANPALRKLNTVVDSAAGKVACLALPGTSLKAFDLQLSSPALQVSPSGPQHFAKGLVTYTAGFRNGKYYFRWSEDDTRSPNYQVRYGTADTPLGKITVPANNSVIAKDAAAGICGTGHSSVIQVPGRDEWYILYHRFTYPQGIRMGGDAGFHHEVCIDKLKFNADGSSKPVKPTHAGIQPVKLK
jgi:hypothetical protein